MTIEESELTISRLINAPRSAMWAGDGFATEMREEGEDFQPHVKGCSLDIVPQERIVFTAVLPDGWQPLEPWLALTAIMTMTGEDNATRYTPRELHRSGEDSRIHEELSFHEGWGTCIDQLGKLAAQLK